MGKAAMSFRRGNDGGKERGGGEMEGDNINELNT